MDRIASDPSFPTCAERIGPDAGPKTHHKNSPQEEEKNHTNFKLMKRI
jgi:hypothetical protein